MKSGSAVDAFIKLNIMAAAPLIKSNICHILRRFAGGVACSGVDDDPEVKEEAKPEVREESGSDGNPRRYSADMSR